MTTLLEKARLVETNKKTRIASTDEQMELIIAYLEGEITASQISKATDSAWDYAKALRWIFDAYQNGLIKKA